MEEKENQLICLVIVYSHSSSPRLKYIIKFLYYFFKHQFKLTANKHEYASSAYFKIYYSNERIEAGEIQISPHVLLFEAGTRTLQPICFKHNGYTAFFEARGDIEFDLFAAIFFLLSRYEEYLPHEKDRFGLYAHHNSIAYKEDFLHQPLINIWLTNFQTLLEEKFAGIEFSKHRFSFLPTYDIDIAWGYKYRGLKKHVMNTL